MQEPVARDSLQTVLESVFAARAYAWPERRDLLGPVRETFRAVIDWFWALEQSRPSAYWALLVAMLVVLGLIIFHAAWVFRRTMQFSRTRRDVEPAPTGPRGAEWHLVEARRLAGAGAYAPALAHRFQATLMVLDGRGLIRVRTDKTPAEYAREARLTPDGRARLGEMVAGLYDVVFGGRGCDLERLRAYDGLAVEVERARAAG